MHFLCKKCGMKRNVTDKFAGKTVVCPQCNTKTKLPDTFPKAPERPGRFSLEDFVKKTGRKGGGGKGLFELESEYLLEINLKNRVWTKAGSMVAHRGEITFTRDGVLEQGVGNLLKKAVGGEEAHLTKAEGLGAMYLADHGKRITILNLSNQTIYVNGHNILAFENSFKWELKMMKRITGMISGGLFNIRLEGTGMIAVTTHHAPFTIPVKGWPVCTDPGATVAWSGNLDPEIKTDISIKSLIGRGSGESVQLQFEGDGFVVVQPFEEGYFQGS